MRAVNKQMADLSTLYKSGQRILTLAPLLLLAACGGMNEALGPSGPNNTAAVRELPAALQTAICEGRGQETANVLLSEPLASASDRFYTALALEEAGSAMRARTLYAAVMQTSSTDFVRARCADRILANGPVVGEAAKHLAALSQQLAALDVNLAPERPLHAGLARTSAIGGNTQSYNPSPSYSAGISQTVSRPASQSPLGQWFAHLSSYGSLESATANRATVEKKFPALTGLIDQWELVVNGNQAIRLGVRVSDKGDALRLCDAIKSQREYCAVIDTSQ